MTDDISDIAAYYSRNPQAEHRRLEENQLEFDLTWRFLEEYLPSQGEVLEIGAGTGQYTLGLVKRGYSVTAVDLSEEILQECQKNLSDAGFEGKTQFILGDARYLRHVPKKEFDAVLIMGPLYHLVEESDRQMALHEAYNRLRPGGVIFSAFISRYGILGEILKYLPESVDDAAQVRSVLTRGRDREDWPKGGFRAYFAMLEEITPLHEGIGFETLKLVGVEPCISHDDESYNVLEGERRRLWLDLFYEISGEPSILGASQHLLYIGRRRLNQSGNSMEKSLKTVTLPENPDAKSPAGAAIRYLVLGETGNMIHSTVPPYQINRATVHKTVNEFWYILEGQGEIWRDNGMESEITPLSHGTAIEIRSGTAFQCRNIGEEDLTFICISMPPWLGDSEATYVEGKWTPTF